MLLFMCLCVFVSDCIAGLNEGEKRLKKSDPFWHIAEIFFSSHVTSVGMFVSCAFYYFNVSFL